MRLAAAAALLAAAACTRDPADPPAAAPAPRADDAAVSLFERRTADDPRDHLSATILADLHLRRATASASRDEYAAAEKAARTALERQPGHPAALVSLTEALVGLGRLDEARETIEPFLDTQPRHVGALGAAFDVAFARGDDRRASALADRLLAINEEPGTLRRLAQVAEKSGDRERAIALLQRAAADAERLGGLPDEIEDCRRREARLAAAAGTETR
jgi:tetratricopeptide (TPR) repeat protein